MKLSLLKLAVYLNLIIYSNGEKENTSTSKAFRFRLILGIQWYWSITAPQATTFISLNDRYSDLRNFSFLKLFSSKPETFPSTFSSHFARTTAEKCSQVLCCGFWNEDGLSVHLRVCGPQTDRACYPKK